MPNLIPYKYLNFDPEAPDRGYWDMTMLAKAFQSAPFEEVGEGWSLHEKMIVVVPARQNVSYFKEINDFIAPLAGVLLILTGDEESSFPVEKISHPNIKIWVMTPHVEKSYPNTVRFIGSGFTQHMDGLPVEVPEKDLRWFFAGQINNDRRFACFHELEKLEGGELLGTPGFTQGFKPEEYTAKMARARVVPCPGGIQTPDSFRVFETLESGAIPVLDVYSGKERVEGYWQLVFGEDMPLRLIHNWSEIPNVIDHFNSFFDTESNKVFAWWQMYKRNFAHGLADDFVSLTERVEKYRPGITVIIPTSPIASNPSTAIIEETIASVRHHLPDAEIIVTFDGVRPEQRHYAEAYAEFTRRMLWKINREYKNVVPIVFQEPMHQVAMAREAMKEVRTDKILYVEHDTPLVFDLAIDFEWSGKMIDTGKADVIRYHFEARIPAEHLHLMLDDPKETVFGVGAIRTVQWSQRPHLASSTFYDRILSDHFTPDARTFIEDKMHSVVQEAFNVYRLQGWERYKLWIYAPEDNLKRSYNLDGRGADPKFDMKF